MHPFLFHERMLRKIYVIYECDIELSNDNNNNNNNGNRKH